MGFRHAHFLGMRVLVAASITFLSGCATQPLRQYLKDYDYLLLEPPRARDGVGTIIYFRDGVEWIVASPDLNECLTEEAVPRGEPVPVALLDTAYTVNSNADLDLNLAKVLDSSVDLVGSFSDSRVRAVKIEFLQPVQHRLTEHGLLTYISELEQNDPCLGYISDPNNYVLANVLGAKGLRYSFLDRTGRTLAIDAKLAEAMSLKPEYAREHKGQQTLTIDFPFFIGVRLWRLRERAGFGGTTYEIQEVDQVAGRDVTLAGRGQKNPAAGP